MRFFWREISTLLVNHRCTKQMLVSFGKKLIGHKWGLFNQIWAEIQTSFCIRIHTKDVSEIYRVHKHCVCQICVVEYFGGKTHRRRKLGLFLKTCEQNVNSLAVRKNLKSVIYETVCAICYHLYNLKT